LRTLSDGLLGRRVPFGVTDRLGDFIPLQSQRMLQDHLDRCSYVEKKVVRSSDQQKPNGQSNPCAHCRADHSVFSLVRRARYA
jgi:hypothetical protein